MLQLTAVEFLPSPVLQKQLLLQITLRLLPEAHLIIMFLMTMQLSTSR